jgi:hypothetical protein
MFPSGSPSSSSVPNSTSILSCSFLASMDVQLFVFICFVHQDLPNHSPSCCSLGTIRKPSMSMVHQVGFIIFDLEQRIYSILNIFSFKIRIKNYRGIQAHFWYCWETLQWVWMNEGDLENFYTWGVREIEFWVVFIIENSIKLHKMVCTPAYVKCKGVPKGRCTKVRECRICRNFDDGSINEAPSN